MRLFDAYIAVDWDSKAVPSPPTQSRDAVWVGERFIDSEGASYTATEEYFRTRRLAERHIRSRLMAHLAAQRRVFLGFDFPYGYPSGFAEALDTVAKEPPWRQVWSCPV